jgi:hypothetical protein
VGLTSAARQEDTEVIGWTGPLVHDDLEFTHPNVEFDMVGAGWFLRAISRGTPRWCTVHGAFVHNWSFGLWRGESTRRISRRAG